MPVCLPNFQPNAFLHAYVACLDPSDQQQQRQPSSSSSSESSSSTMFLLLSGSADAFHKLSAARQALVAALTVHTQPGAPAEGVLARLRAAAAAPGAGRLRVEQLPPPLGERHCPPHVHAHATNSTSLDAAAVL